MARNDGPIIVTGTVVTVTGWKTNRQSAQLPQERGIKFAHERNGTEYEDWMNVDEESPWADAYKKGMSYQFEKVWDASAKNGKGGFYYMPHGDPGAGGGPGAQRTQGGGQRTQGGGQRAQGGGQRAQGGGQRAQGGGQRTQASGGRPQARAGQGGAQRAQAGGGGGYSGWDDGDNYEPEPQMDRPVGFDELVKFTDWMLSKGKFQNSPMTMLMTKLVADNQIQQEQARWSVNQLKRIRGLVAMLAEVEKNQQ